MLGNDIPQAKGGLQNDAWPLWSDLNLGLTMHLPVTIFTNHKHERMTSEPNLSPARFDGSGGCCIVMVFLERVDYRHSHYYYYYSQAVNQKPPTEMHLSLIRVFIA